MAALEEDLDDRKSKDSMTLDRANRERKRAGGSRRGERAEGDAAFAIDYAAAAIQEAEYRGVLDASDARMEADELARGQRGGRAFLEQASRRRPT